VIRFEEIHRGRTITFGFGDDAQVRAERVEHTADGVSFQVNGVPMKSSLEGRHSILNILAGLAVASIYGIRPEQLTGVVQQLSAGTMRGERLTHNGILILNDCYNSNPDAARAMIDVLRDTPAKRRIAVLGEMLELGRWSESLHRDLGRYAAASGVDVLVGVHGAAQFLVEEARNAGQAEDAALFFADAASAGDHLRQFAQPGDAILFKGSRGTHVEQALERVLARSN
jgi:UDP-N-acetylmuramoyl-tripeptide--D-alanyl-D-alanine ligase